MFVLVATFVVALILGVPVAFSLGLAAVAFLAFSDMPLQILPTIVFGGMDSFPLMAIPFFILTGELMSRCGVLPRLMEFANSIVGHFRGGLGYVNVSASMLFSGVTGVSIADAAAVGSTLIPSMIREGYPPAFAAALTAAASVMGAIIPPSVAMLIIAYIYGGEVSVGTLFLAGATPGVLIGLGLMTYVLVSARRRGFPVSSGGFSVIEVLYRLRRALAGLLVPVIVLGGILGGIFTATEAGAIAAAYSFVLGVVVLRTIGLRDVYEALLSSAKVSAIIFMLLGTAKVVAFVLVTQQVPQQLAGAIQQMTSSPQVFLLLVVALFFLLGFVMEGVATMIMIVPIVVPIAKAFGVDPHHLCLVIVMTVQIALITPPVALSLFVTTPMAGCTMEQVTPEVAPMVLIVLGVVVLVVFAPAVAMWLPRVAG
ncbi:MAG: TRAP transporter large permease [Alphaproteobacteria bacterium]